MHMSAAISTKKVQTLTVIMQWGSRLAALTFFDRTLERLPNTVSSECAAILCDVWGRYGDGKSRRSSKSGRFSGQKIDFFFGESKFVREREGE